MKNNGTPKKNILIVTSSLTFGGSETVILNLCTQFDTSRFNITVCHLMERGLVGEKIEELGIDITGIKRKSGVLKYFSFLSLLDIINEKNIDLVHSHTTYSLLDSSLCKIISWKLKLVHTFHFGNYPHYNKKYMFLEKIFCRIPDMLVPVGYRQKQQIKAIYPIRENKTRVIWNGVDTQANPDRELVEKYSNVDKIIIGTICMFTKQKGLEYLLEVIKELKSRDCNFVMLIVGGGPLEKQIKQLCDELELHDHVEFLGLYQNAAERVLPLFDVFVQTSLWEAMSIAILEAMANAKPIVATDVGDNKKVVSDGGYIVDALDVQGMANYLEKLINDQELRIKLGKNAYRTYNASCSTKEMAKNYEELFLELLK